MHKASLIRQITYSKELQYQFPYHSQQTTILMAHIWPDEMTCYSHQVQWILQSVYIKQSLDTNINCLVDLQSGELSLFLPRVFLGYLVLMEYCHLCFRSHSKSSTKSLQHLVHPEKWRCGWNRRNMNLPKGLKCIACTIMIFKVLSTVLCFYFSDQGRKRLMKL